MRAIFWTSVARFDLRRLRTWTERYSPAKAASQSRRIRIAIEALIDNPRLGHPLPLPDEGDEELRELILAPYVIRYTVAADRVVIIRLWRGREDRDWYSA